MKENFGLDASKENFAWSFDGVPEENSLNLEIGGKVLKSTGTGSCLLCAA